VAARARTLAAGAAACTHALAARAGAHTLAVRSACMHVSSEECACTLAVGSTRAGGKECARAGSGSRSARIGQQAALGQAGSHARVHGQAAAASRRRHEWQQVVSGRGQVVVVTARAGRQVHYATLHFSPPVVATWPPLAAHCLQLAAYTCSLQPALATHACSLHLWLMAHALGTASACMRSLPPAHVLPATLRSSACPHCLLAHCSLRLWSTACSLLLRPAAHGLHLRPMACACSLWCALTAYACSLCLVLTAPVVSTLSLQLRLTLTACSSPLPAIVLPLRFAHAPCCRWVHTPCPPTTACSTCLQLVTYPCALPQRAPCRCQAHASCCCCQACCPLLVCWWPHSTCPYVPPLLLLLPLPLCSCMEL
jgi:hypothetical protein